MALITASRPRRNSSPAAAPVVVGEDVLESMVGTSGVRLTHVPTGCSVESYHHGERRLNRTEATRLLNDAVADFCSNESWIRRVYRKARNCIKRWS